jgi:two-component system alkaline phosphatase synthesis response regulator PhoP
MRDIFHRFIPDGKKDLIILYWKTLATMKNILMIEDDPNIVELVGIHLKDIHCQHTAAGSGMDGIRLAMKKPFDLIILDLMLPDIDGIEVCKRLRAEKVATPILMLTARSEEIDKIIGLETGADDYLTKPFSIREFIARVKAILRRTDLDKSARTVSEDILSCGDLVMDPAKRKVMRGNNKVELTPKEFDLLHLFMTNPGKSYSREDLLNIIWGYEFSGYEHTVNAHINRLRTKIETEMSKPEFILTTWGVGYRFTDEK